jgi:replication-associated recombination protein RarA
MEKQVRKEADGPVEASLSKQPQEFVMALFRATMNEVACSMIELMNKRVDVAHAKQGDASFFNTCSVTWPSLLRATGSDVSAMLSDVARTIAAGGNPANAAHRARALLMAHPDAPAIRARNAANT